MARLLSRKALIVGLIFGGLAAGTGLAIAQGGGANQASRQTAPAISAGNPTGPGEINLKVDGDPQSSPMVADLVEQCRGGNAISDEGPAADALYCNAIRKIAGGQLNPTGTTPDGRPLWSYSEDQLRNLPQP